MQKSSAYSQLDVLGFVKFLVIFEYIWEEIVFLKTVVKFGEIRDSEDFFIVQKLTGAKDSF